MKVLPLIAFVSTTWFPDGVLAFQSPSQASIKSPLSRGLQYRSPTHTFIDALPRRSSDARRMTDHPPLGRLSLSPQRSTRTSPRLRSWIQAVRTGMKLLRRRTAVMSMAFLFVFLTFTGAAQAVTGGRTGGSFGPSSSGAPSPPSISRSAPRRTMHYHRHSPSINVRIVTHSGSPYGYGWGGSGWGGNGWGSYGCSWGGSGWGSFGCSWGGSGWGGSNGWGYAEKQLWLRSANRSPKQITVAEKAVLATVGAAAVYSGVNSKSYRENYRRLGVEFGGPLGSGATATSLTVALNVPNRDDPNNILAALERISNHADTKTRRGVQNLVSDVALELLRKEESVVSAHSDSSRHRTPALAERAFQAQSIRSRSKFDRESIYKFGDQVRRNNDLPGDSSTRGKQKATIAIVTLNFAIEGDSTIGSSRGGIRGREDLLEALSKIVTDVQVNECLLAGEVLWAPTAPGEVLSPEDLYADYPNLLPL